MKLKKETRKHRQEDIKVLEFPVHCYSNNEIIWFLLVGQRWRWSEKANIEGRIEFENRRTLDRLGIWHRENEGCRRKLMHI